MQRTSNKNILLSICCSILIILFPNISVSSENNHNVDANNTKTTEKQTTLPDGRKIYLSYCVQCHGAEGKGDGRLTRIINDPPPYNLTKSTRSPAYLENIITNGGASLSRSNQMPEWKEELSKAEIESVVIFLLTLRQ